MYCHMKIMKNISVVSLFFLGVLSISSLNAQESVSEEEKGITPIRPTFFFTESIITAPIRNPGFQFYMGIRYTDADFQNNSQTLRVRPSFHLNKFSVAIDLRLRTSINLSQSPSFAFVVSDWIPTDIEDGLDKYLPLLRLRYGTPEDPFYANLGPLENVTFGNGFLVRNYANDPYNMTRSGIAFKVDGKGLNFPYLGIEGFWGDIAYQDLVVIRSFSRPLAFLPSVFSDLELGAVVALDRHNRLPNLLSSVVTSSSLLSSALASSQSMTLFAGIDLNAPVLSTETTDLFITADYLWQQKNAHAASLGLQTRLWSFFTLHFQGQYFINSTYAPYFHRNFETSAVANSLSRSQYSSLIAWETGMKFSFLDEGLWLEVISSGPLLPGTLGKEFSIGGQFTIRRGKVSFLPGLSLSFFYEKTGLTSGRSLLSDSYIGGKLGLSIHRLLLELAAELTSSSVAQYSTRISIQGGISL